MTNSVFRSTDAGATFDVRLYTAPSGMTISGVEAASDGNTIFVTLASALAPAAIIGRSIDGGQTWTLTDLSSQLGPGTLRLIAVDRKNANRVFLLWVDASGQALAVTTDAGATAAKPLVPDGTIKNFIQMTSGTVLVATEANGIQSLFRSQDDLLTFQSVFKPPHARAFAERDGVLYAAADNVHDGYAIGTSTDEGTTWQALMSYSAVNAIAACVKTACQATCAMEVGIGLWSAAVCSADAPSTSGTGGAGGSLTDAAVDGPADGGGGAGIAPGRGGRCRCGRRGHRGCDGLVRRRRRHGGTRPERLGRSRLLVRRRAAGTELRLRRCGADRVLLVGDRTAARRRAGVSFAGSPVNAKVAVDYRQS